MKLAQGLGLALSGAVVGASLVGVLHAQATETPAYLVANIEQVNDAGTFAKYRAEVGKIEASFGGSAIVRGAPQAVDGSTLPKGDIVIIRFPSMKMLRDWWNSPAYSAIRPLREKATVGRIYAVEGLKD
jgi:uncharacterized protein (DUF1330 family)